MNKCDEVSKTGKTALPIEFQIFLLCKFTEIKFKADENEKEQHIYSGQLNPSSLKGFHAPLHRILLRPVDNIQVTQAKPQK
uniref:Uncharacterized protein n=1 Tax=Solanum lycopersicum TaxID=4081 RepID=A0A3Q7FLR0_SOLLC